MDKLKDRYNSLLGKIELLKSQKESKKQNLKSLKIEYEDLSKARFVISEVAKLTQERFQKRVESLVTMAIKSVFNRDFEFKLIFEKKRNKFECRPVLIENGEEFSPEDDRGGAVIDIISFAFRVVLWSLENPRSRNVFILDEPMKNLGKGEMLERTGRMLKEISHRLGFQLILITHEVQLAGIADRTFMVSYDGEVSSVKILDEEKPQTRKLLRR